jgi:hypothetical protein
MRRKVRSTIENVSQEYSTEHLPSAFGAGSLIVSPEAKSSIIVPTASDSRAGERRSRRPSDESRKRRQGMSTKGFKAKSTKLPNGIRVRFMEHEQILILQEMRGDEIVIPRESGSMYRLYQFLDGYFRTSRGRARGRTSA